MKEGQTVPVGDFIKDSRLSRGLSLRQAQKVTGVHFTHIINIERGRRGITRDTLDRISKGFGLDRDELYMVAGFWPPSITASHAALEVLQRHQKAIPQTGRKHLPVYSERSLKDTNSLIDKSVKSKESLRPATSGVDDFAQRMGFETWTQWNSFRIKELSNVHS